MFLDKIKSMMVSVIIGTLAAVVAAAVAFQLIARSHHTTSAHALQFVRAQPVRYWPGGLQFGIPLALVAGALITLGIWQVLKNHRWSYRPRRVDNDEAISKLLAKTTKEVFRIFAGKFGGKPLYVSSEDRGLVIGPPGTGKTAFLFNQLLRLSKVGAHFVCVDIKPELHRITAPTLAAAGYRVLRLNPAFHSKNADHWNPLDDIKDETDIAELCSALLPIRDAKEAPFIEAQRDWLKAAVFHMSSIDGGSLPGAFNLLSGSPDPLKILEILSRSTNAPAVRLANRIAAGLSGGKPDPLILQGLTGALRSLDYLGLPGVQDALGYSDFSVRDLGKGEQPIALFLQFQEAKLNALGSLLAFVANGVLTSLIETAGERKPVTLFLDELGNMPPIPNLPEKLNTIRSRDIPTWMYFQTSQQQDTRYGHGAISTFFASADFVMCFRLNDQSTRELISNLLGTTEVEKTSYSRTGSNGTTTRSRKEAAVLQPYELGQLKDSEVLVMYRGAAAIGKATPHFVDFPKFVNKRK